MSDEDRSKNELLKEIAELRRQVEELEAVEAERWRAKERLQHLTLVLRAIRNVNQLIATEHDRARLLAGVCKTLTATRGYHNVWIVLLDESGRYAASAEAGLGEGFEPVVERMKRGDLTRCAREALSQPDPVVVADPPSTCKECPLAERYAGWGAITARLEHGGRVYGLLAASVQGLFVEDEEERALFKEVAADVGFALHDLEQEEKRRRAEEALLDSEELYRTLLKAVPDAMTETDLTGRVTFVSQRTVELHGAEKAEDLVGRNALELIAPEDHERAMSNLRRTLEEGAVRDVEYTFLRTDGRRFPGELSSALLRDAGGEPKSFVAITRDITERKRAEEELRASHAGLRSLASELVLAEERERRHIATWLHDNISQTLAFSKMKLAALRETVCSTDCAGPLDELSRALDQAIQETRSMTFELGSPVLYQLGLEAAVEALAEQFQEKFGIACRFEDDGQPKPLGEEAKITLFRAVRELLVNIVKHARATIAEVTMRRAGDTIRIDVVDNGVGFDASLQGFHDGKSGGFGLFSIRERLSHVGGELRVESGHVSRKGRPAREQGGGTRAALVAPLKRGRVPGRSEAP